MRWSLSFLIFLIIIFGSVNVFAQQSGSGNNYLALTVNNSLTFSFKNTTDLETTQTIANALTVSLRSKDYNCTVSAKASINSNTTTPLPENMLILQYTGTSSTNGSPVTTPITLSTGNTQLFTQPKTSAGNTVNYNYDLKMSPLGYTYAPGTYNISLTFTMTQQ